MAYYGIQPFGPERADFHAGLVTSAIYNVNRSKKTKAFSPEDFMPKPRSTGHVKSDVKRVMGTFLGKKG